jgi:MFS family permease
MLSTPRSGIMLVFSGFGAAVGAWAGAIPQVTKAIAINNYDLGLVMAVASIATVITMSLGGALGKHMSNRRVILLALPVLGVVTLALLTAQSLSVFAASLIAWAGILGLLDLFMNAEASAIEHDLRRPIFTAFHGAVSLSIAGFAILSSFVSAQFGPACAAGLAALVLLLAWVVVYRQVPSRLNLAGEAVQDDRKPMSWVLVVMGLIVGLSVTVETSALFWSAKLLDEQAPSLAAIAGLGVAFFGLCNAVMRFAGDDLRRRFGDIPVLLLSIGVAIIGLVGLGLSTRFALSTFAFAAVGFGLALNCPCLFNMAAAQAPGHRAGALSFMSAVAGPPRILAPWIFGWVATAQSTQFAFGLCAGVMVVAFILVVLLRRLLLTAPDMAKS